MWILFLCVVYWGLFVFYVSDKCFLLYVYSLIGNIIYIFVVLVLLFIFCLFFFIWLICDE